MKKSLLFILVVCFSWTAKSQVYTAGTMFSSYTDLSPDSLLHYVYFPYTNQIVDLHVFGGPADVQFNAKGGSASGGSIASISVTSLGPTVYLAFGRLDSVYDSTSTSWLVTKVAKPLAMGEPINAPGTIWENSLMYISDHSASFGWMKDIDDWIGGEKYLGFKYDDGTNTSYGWIRLECRAQDSCYVKDFASSDLMSGIEEIDKEVILIYPNPGTSKFMVSFTEASPAREITVYDALGNIKLKILAGTKKMEIDLSDEPAGIYFVRLTTDESTVTRKIIKEK